MMMMMMMMGERSAHSQTKGWPTLNTSELNSRTLQVQVFSPLPWMTLLSWFRQDLTRQSAQDYGAGLCENPFPLPSLKSYSDTKSVQSEECRFFQSSFNWTHLKFNLICHVVWLKGFPKTNLWYYELQSFNLQRNEFWLNPFTGTEWSSSGTRLDNELRVISGLPVYFHCLCCTHCEWHSAGQWHVYNPALSLQLETKGAARRSAMTSAPRRESWGYNQRISITSSCVGTLFQILREIRVYRAPLVIASI